MSIYGFGEGKNKKDTYTAAELDAIFAEINGTLTGLGDTVTAQGETLASQGETIAGHTETLASQGQTIASQGETIALHTQQIADRTFSVISVTIPSSAWTQNPGGTAYYATVSVSGMKATYFAACGPNANDISVSSVGAAQIVFITREIATSFANISVLVFVVPVE
jgi:hypothetical protein